MSTIVSEPTSGRIADELEVGADGRRADLSSARAGGGRVAALTVAGLVVAIAPGRFRAWTDLSGAPYHSGFAVTLLHRPRQADGLDFLWGRLGALVCTILGGDQHPAELDEHVVVAGAGFGGVPAGVGAPVGDDGGVGSGEVVPDDDQALGE